MNRVVIGLFIILLFLAIGNIVNLYLIPMLPGSVIGMVLLFAALQLKIVKESSVESVAKYLVSTMPIYFIPITVGIIAILPSIGDDALIGAIVVVVSTVIGIPAIGLFQQWLGKKGEKQRDDR